MTPCLCTYAFNALSPTMCLTEVLNFTHCEVVSAKVKWIVYSIMLATTVPCLYLYYYIDHTQQALK